MRLRALCISSLAGLAGLTDIAFADVSGSRSGDPPSMRDYALAAYSAQQPTLSPYLFGVSAQLAHPPVGAPKIAQAPLRYDQASLDARPAAQGDAEWECLAQAIYFEARGESLKGQFAVAEVILNRVESPLYPSTICRVVHQGGSGGCQFSFTCDGLSDRIREKVAFRTAGKIARLMLDGAPRTLTDGATHFHTRNVRPGWAHRMPRTASIGQHMFYRVASGG